MRNLEDQLRDANTVFASASLSLAAAVSKLPESEQKSDVARWLGLQQRADKMRTEILLSFFSKFAMQLQGGLLDLEVANQLVKSKNKQTQ